VDSDNCFSLSLFVIHIVGFICSVLVFCPKVKISDSGGGGDDDYVSVQAIMKVFKSEA
jgi:hypothetical protein